MALGYVSAGQTVLASITNAIIDLLQHLTTGHNHDGVNSRNIAVTKILAFSSGTQTINSGVSGVVVFGSTTFDTNSEYNSGTGYFWPKTSGYYLISANITLLSATTAFFLSITRNTSIGVVGNQNNISGVNTSYSVTGLVFLNAGDYVCVNMLPYTSNVGVYGSTGATSLNIVKVSP